LTSVLNHKHRFRPKSVVVRGIKYPSRIACAKALGVSQSAVSQAARRGTLDTIGTGHQNMSKDQRKSIVHKKDVDGRIKYDRQLNRIE
jgi:hypothetical protein